MATHGCTGGWMGTDKAGRPVPCLVCKPHLAGPWSQVNDCDPAVAARRPAVPAA